MRPVKSPAQVALTQRDISIISFLYQVGGSTVDHLLRLFYPTYRTRKYGPRSPAYDRLSKLIEAGYLRAQRLPSLTGVGSGKRFLTVGKASYGLLADRLGHPRQAIAKAARELTPFAAAHHLAIVDFLVSLQLALKGQSAVSLVEWIPERELRATPHRIEDPLTKQTVVLIPDASFELRLADGSGQTFLLEQDMGTVAPKRIKAKLRGYLIRGRQNHQPILWVVPDRPRQEAIRSWAIEQAATVKADPTIFWAACAPEISERTILTPIWTVAGGPEAHSLAPITHETIAQPAGQAFGELILSGGRPWRS
jgi:hypothetical protein